MKGEWLPLMNKGSITGPRSCKRSLKVVSTQS